MLIQVPKKQFLTDLQAAITYAKNRPPQLQSPISEEFGPGITNFENTGSGTYLIRVNHWAAPGATGNHTVLVLKIAVATADCTEKAARQQPALSKEAEKLLKTTRAVFKESSMLFTLTGNEPYVWLTKVRWD